MLEMYHNMVVLSNALLRGRVIDSTESHCTEEGAKFLRDLAQRSGMPQSHAITVVDSISSSW